MTKTKLYILIAVLVVLCLLLWFISGKRAKAPVKTPQAQSQLPANFQKPLVPTLQVTTTTVPDKTLPQAFPSDIPLEKGAAITQNYNAAAQNGMYQATRVFVTAKTLDQNFTIYSNYIKTAGWTLATSVNQPNIKVLSATKGYSSLQITMSQNTVTKQNTVNISYTTPQTAANH